VFVDGLLFFRTRKSDRATHTGGGAGGAGVVVIIGVVDDDVDIGVVVGAGVVVVVGFGVVVVGGAGVVVVVVVGAAVVVVGILGVVVVVVAIVVVEGGGVVVVVVVGNMVRGDNLQTNSTPLRAALALLGPASAVMRTRTKPVVECSWYLFSCIVDNDCITSVVNAC